MFSKSQGHGLERGGEGVAVDPGGRRVNKGHFHIPAGMVVRRGGTAVHCVLSC